MKKVYLLAIIAVLAMSSCATLTTVSNKQQAPRFTTVDKVLALKPGMSYSEVVTTLGSAPYDLLSLTYDDKQTVYVWYYKKIERKEDPKVMLTKEGGATGDEVIDIQQMLYVTFDANGKLVKATTDAGLGKQPAAFNLGTTETTVTQEKKPIWKVW